jgi:hypothetical protein
MCIRKAAYALYEVKSYMQEQTYSDNQNRMNKDFLLNALYLLGCIYSCRFPLLSAWFLNRIICNNNRKRNSIFNLQLKLTSVITVMKLVEYALPSAADRDTLPRLV